MAKRVNVPKALLQALATQSPNCFLVHLSTDQVYDGSTGAPHVETVEPRPINAYVHMPGTGADFHANSNHINLIQVRAQQGGG